MPSAVEPVTPSQGYPDNVDSLLMAMVHDLEVPNPDDWGKHPDRKEYVAKNQPVNFSLTLVSKNYNLRLPQSTNTIWMANFKALSKLSCEGQREVEINPIFSATNSRGLQQFLHTTSSTPSVYTSWTGKNVLPDHTGQFQFHWFKITWLCMTGNKSFTDWSFSVTSPWTMWLIIPEKHNMYTVNKLGLCLNLPVDVVSASLIQEAGGLPDQQHCKACPCQHNLACWSQLVDPDPWQLPQAQWCVSQ